MATAKTASTSIKGAGGLGHLLAQQLVAAGERVLDVPLKLAARVRLLGSGATDKNDPNDDRSVAIAALRWAAYPPVHADDHAAVLTVWAKRHRDLSRARSQVACRMHAVLCQLIPGGVSKPITAGQAARILEAAEPQGAAAGANVSLRANPKLTLTASAVPGQPGAWILSSEGVNAAGQPVSTIPASCEQAISDALGSHRGTTVVPGGSTALNNCVASHGIRVAESYQPASHYWPLQWSETGMFLALALALACYCFWRLNRRRS